MIINNDPEIIIGYRRLGGFIGICASTIRRLQMFSDFPLGKRLPTGKRTSYWLKNEVLEWCQKNEDKLQDTGCKII